MLIINLVLCKRSSSLSLYRFSPKYCNFDEREGGVRLGIAPDKNTSMVVIVSTIKLLVNTNLIKKPNFLFHDSNQ